MRGREQHRDLDFVTSAGELLSRHGVFSGGLGNGNASASLLARKNEIAELEKELDGVGSNVDDQSREKGDMQAEQTALQAGLQEEQTELRQLPRSLPLLLLLLLRIRIMHHKDGGSKNATDLVFLLSPQKYPLLLRPQHPRGVRNKIVRSRSYHP